MNVNRIEQDPPHAVRMDHDSASLRRRGRAAVGRVCMVVSLLLIHVGQPQATAVDWPNFRGVRHDGISDEKGLKTSWTNPIPMTWERSLGESYSSMACVGNRIYTCGARDQKQMVYCLDADTGKVAWEKAFAGEYTNSYGNGPRATPTVRDGRVYIQGGHGRLACLNADTGAELWSKQFDKSHEPTWGYSGSVLVEGDLAIAIGGGSDGSMAAFNRTTGEPVWTCGNDPAGYATPYPFTFKDRRFVAALTGSSILVADIKTGRQVLHIPWVTDWNVNAASPIFHNGHLLITSGYRTGSGLFKLSLDGDKLAAVTVWKNKVLMNKFQSCVLHEGKLYSSDQKSFKCVDFMTGEQAWEQKRVKHGTVTLADGFLYLLTEEGELRIGKASPEGFRPTTTASVLSGRCWTVPVLHRGRIYARNFDRIVCFDLRP